MLLPLENAVASMQAAVRRQENIANNLANANTAGYKRSRLSTEALDERLDAEGAPRTTRRLLQATDQTQGALQSTGNPLDVALNGEGFFVLMDAATGARRYTRAGHFLVGPEGRLQTPAGDLVEGVGGPIQLPPGGRTVEISRDGTVRADGRRIGTLRVVTFPAPEQLQRLDGTAFAAGQAPTEVPQPHVMQGFLEASNVEPVTAMTEMIEHFRLFESQQKVLQTTDQILGRITRELGSF